MVITMEEMHKIVREVLLERKAKNGKAKQPMQHKKYSGQKYTASAGSVASIKKHGGSVEKAVKSGDFDWADSPYAAAQAAHIVAMGKPSVEKGEKRKKMSEASSSICEECGVKYEGSSCSECGY